MGILLRRAGETITKEELLDAAWPGVTVVEASLPTAIRKLRIALNDDKDDDPIIETIPRVGYRLTVPVEVQNAVSQFDRRLAHAEPVPVESVLGATRGRAVFDWVRRRRWGAAGVALAVVLVAGSLVAANRTLVGLAAPASKRPPYTQDDVNIALRKLDVERVEQLLRMGWNPNTPYDDGQGNGALTAVLNICEWDVDHDRKRMVLMVRTLLDGGAKLGQRNIWGDTPYSIAKAPRYCGPDHPVTKMLKALCYNGYKPLGDGCLATYELARRKTKLRKT